MDQLLDTAPCGFLSFTDDGIVQSVNATLLDLLGSERDEVQGKHFEKILSVAGRIFYQTHFFPLLRMQEKADEIYLSLRSKRGSDVPVLVNAVRRVRDEKLVNDCIFVPIRQRNQYEDEIIKARKEAENATRAKDEFLAVVSHELRTPLNAILGWASMLRGGKLNEQMITRAIDVIERNAKSQSQLIEDLLDFSRIISGKLRLEVRRVNLSSVIERAVDVVRPAAEAKGIRLQLLLDTKIGPVSGDPDRLQQVMWNLLSNAVKFTPKDGRVQVRLEQLDSHVAISVSDTGLGIGADFLPYVFERFRQADNTSSRRHGGLGLGMAITRQLIELHGGTISVFSPGENEGTTFTINLPLMIVHNTEQQPLATEHGSATNDLPRLDGLNVLIVDDTADAHELLATVLKINGAQVTSATTVAEAIEKLQLQNPDVLVSDIEMPGEDGYSLIRRIRNLENEQTAKIPAIALTARVGAADRLQALAAGFQMHVPKPVEPAELIMAIANLCNPVKRK